MKYSLALILVLLTGCIETPKYEVGQCVVADFTTLRSAYDCSHVWKIASISALQPIVYASYPSVADQERGCPHVRLLMDEEIKKVVDCPEDFYVK